MARIHMSPESIRILERNLNQWADQLLNEVHEVKRASRFLSIAWNAGSNSTNYFSHVNSWINQCEMKANELQMLSVRLNREVDEWVSADSQGQSDFLQFRIREIGSTIGAALGNFIYLGELNPYPLKDLGNYLLNSPAGKNLIEMADVSGIYFIFEDGTIIGNPNGVECTVRYGATGSGTLGFQRGNEIVISDDLPWQKKDIGIVAGVLAHEMQHAVERDAGILLDYSGYENCSDIDQLERFLEERTETRLGSEIRAFERSEAVENSEIYSDDGIETESERRRILFDDYPYAKGYEEDVEDLLKNQYDVVVGIDGKGKLDINLTPLHNLTSFSGVI